ncbi:membrane protein insertase YidC [Mycoplasma phocoenae]|uniref:Membrane protein insertase YidC n=1 Tax=Mycoplasma phocoenae TaxID=754517 RepID=A0A858U594_9MOLU|nr:membrane protein insertase YidC [Mycoplasma phocoenae]QJG67221.1 membrane protein insertase YidC [Mycoplasma phocoenae]
MSKRTRSKHYDLFSPKNGSNDPKDKKEQRLKTLKKIWKWFKILIIIFIIGTGLAGCIQSFGLRSPVKVGSGFETHLKSKDVSPNVESFTYNKESGLYIRSNTDKITDVNPYLAVDTPEDLEKIKKQIKDNGGDFETYKSRTLGIQLRDSDNKLLNNSSVYNNNGNYLVYAAGDQDGNGAVSSYKNVLTWTNLYNFNAVWEKNEDQKNKDAKESQSGPVNPKLLDVSYTVLKDSINNEADSKQKFARDVFQLFAYESANKLQSVIGKTKINENSSKTYWEFIKENSTAAENASAIDTLNSFILNLANNKNKTFTTDEYNAIIRIQSIVNASFTTYGGLTNFTLVSDKKDSNNANLIQLSNVSIKGNYVGIEDSYLFKLFGEPHRPIATWGEYWSFGPFYGLFVYPINQMVGGLINAMSSLGGWSVIIALIITVIVTRLLTVSITYKSIFASQKQQELNAKKAKIEAKYVPYKGDKQMEQKKRNEINEMYKKNKANPYTALVSQLVTLPILLVMFRIVQASPEIKHSVWYGIQMAATSYRNVADGQYHYLPIIIVSVLTQLVAQLLPRFLTRKNDKLRTNVYEREALKKSNRMQNIMTFVFVAFGIVFQAGLQIYWVITGLWQIMQTLVVYKLERTDFYKRVILPKL